VQTHRNIEVIVTDNAEGHCFKTLNKKVCDDYFLGNVTYINTALPSCYHSAEVGAEMAKGRFVVFPSDDSYYCPVFAEVMLKAMDERELDLLLCGVVYNGRWPDEPYHLMDVAARLNHVDKTSFMLKCSLFPGFPDKGDGGSCAADGLLIDRLVAGGIRHDVINDILVVHN
jgi:hypothetical protein